LLNRDKFNQAGNTSTAATYELFAALNYDKAGDAYNVVANYTLAAQAFTLSAQAYDASAAYYTSTGDLFTANQQTTKANTARNKASTANAAAGN
jgi:hypothetical protein